MSDGTRKNHDGRSNGDGRFPPPAFPPGSRLRARTEPRSPVSQDLDGALIQPDDPIPDRANATARRAEGTAARPEVREAFVATGDQPTEDVSAMAHDDAFISPDEPIPHREPVKPGERFNAEGVDPADGVVTGMGSDAHLDPRELVAGGDPYVMALVSKVTKLAEALKQRGEAGLRTGPGMDRFEATLRAYCVGYLAGRRAEEGD